MKCGVDATCMPPARARRSFSKSPRCGSLVPRGRICTREGPPGTRKFATFGTVRCHSPCGTRPALHCCGTRLLPSGELPLERRILIIDDDRSMCDVLEAELKKRGMQTMTTTSPEDGLRRLVEDDFDLVNTDINMHGMSGVDV